MKKLYILLIALLLTSPLNTFAVTATWQATSTTQGWIGPTKINGVEQTVTGNNFIATSTAATSTFSGNLEIDKVLSVTGVPAIIQIPSQNDYFFGGAGNLSLSGSGNIGLGVGSGNLLTTAGGNAFFGRNSLSKNVSSGNNVALGNFSLFNLVSGSGGNTALGSNSGLSLTTGSNDVFIGINSGSSGCQKVDAVNSIAIGANTCTTADNQIILGNSSIQTVGIGTSSPYSKLSVAGQVVAQNFVATSTTDVNTFAGNVGIGSTSPTNLLTVNGGPNLATAYFYNNNSSGKTQVTIRDGAGNTTGSPSEAAFQVLNNAGSQVFTIRGDGLAAAETIGTVDNATGILTQDNNAFAHPGININSTAGLYWTNDSVFYDTKDIGISRLSAGKLGVGNGSQGDSSATLIADTVGISAASPLTKLEVNGAVLSDTSSATISPGFTSWAGNNSVFNFAGAAGYWGIRTTAATFGDFALDVYNNGSPLTALTVTQAGKIGIGTTTPGTLFSVAGAVNVSTATSTFFGTGGITIKNGCFALSNGVCLTGIKTPAFNSPATTTWTGTTTEQVLGSPTTSQDILGAACWTDAGTAKVDIYHGTTHLALVSVTTTNTVTSFTSNNSMTAFEKFFYKAGTPAGGVNNAHCTLILKPTSN